MERATITSINIFSTSVSLYLLGSDFHSAVSVIDDAYCFAYCVSQGLYVVLVIV